ncbi:unnamed protein product [Rotaria sp. Silwood2]|nr:unnamed protein product [Rotaria sp. Silwood2]
MTISVNYMIEILYFINYEPEVIENPNEHILPIDSANMNDENCTILIDTHIIHPIDLVMNFYQNSHFD